MALIDAESVESPSIVVSLAMDIDVEVEVDDEEKKENVSLPTSSRASHSPCITHHSFMHSCTYIASHLAH